MALMPFNCLTHPFIKTLIKTSNQYQYIITINSSILMYIILKSDSIKQLMHLRNTYEIYVYNVYNSKQLNALLPDCISSTVSAILLSNA